MNLHFFKKNYKRNLVIITAVIITLLASFNFSLVINKGEVFAQSSASSGLNETAGEAGLPAPKGSVAEIIGQIIYILLGFLGIIFIILLIYGGFIYMTAQGDATKTKTAMGIITSAIIGVAIILASYAITAFVMGKIEDTVGNGTSETACLSDGQGCENSTPCCSGLSCKYTAGVGNLEYTCQP